LVLTPCRFYHWVLTLEEHKCICLIGRPSPYYAVNTLCFGYKTDKLKPYREIIAVCSEIHVKHINALWEEQRISEC
jgi:hypothetical protein